MRELVLASPQRLYQTLVVKNWPIRDAGNNDPAPPPVPVPNEDVAPAPVNHNNNEIVINNNNEMNGIVLPALVEDNNGDVEERAIAAAIGIERNDPLEPDDDYFNMVNDMFCETAEDSDDVSSEQSDKDIEDVDRAEEDSDEVGNDGAEDEHPCKKEENNEQDNNVEHKFEDRGKDNVIVEQLPSETEHTVSIEACENECSEVKCDGTPVCTEDENNGVISGDSSHPVDTNSNDKGTETITSSVTSTLACCPNCGKNVTIVTGLNGTSEVTKTEEGNTVGSNKEEKEMLGLIEDGEKPGPSSNKPVVNPPPRRPSVSFNSNAGALIRNTDESSELLTASNLLTTEQRVPKSYNGKGKGGKKSAKGSQINQSCQAVSEEIRESTKKAKVSDTEDDSGTDTETDSPSLSTAGSPASASIDVIPVQIGAMQIDNDSVASRVANSRRTVTAIRQQQTIRKPNMCDQATSTSDPVIEEDHVQVSSGERCKIKQEPLNYNFDRFILEPRTCSKN